MGQRDDLGSIQGTRFFVGLSTIIGITVTPYQIAETIKFTSGSSLEVGGATLTWGIGYLMTALEAINLDSSCTLYFAATGATARVDILKGFSQGAGDS